MKKLIALFLVCVMAVSFAACTKTEDQTPVEEEIVTEPEAPVDAEPEVEADAGDEVPVEEPSADAELPVEPEQPAEIEGSEDAAEDPIVTDLLEKLSVLVDGVNDGMMVENVEIPADQYPYQLFIEYAEGYHAVMSAPMIGSIAHSVCLLQLPEDADVEAVAQEIEANMDPRKWICVEAEATAVKTSGSYVLMVMSNQEAVDAIVANFDAMFA